jgi:hypothetical protein
VQKFTYMLVLPANIRYISIGSLPKFNAHRTIIAAHCHLYAPPRRDCLRQGAQAALHRHHGRGVHIMQARFNNARLIALIIIAVGIAAIAMGLLRQGQDVFGFVPQQVLALGILWAVIGFILWFLIQPQDEPTIDLSGINRLETQVKGYDNRFRDLDARLEAKVNDVDTRLSRRFGDYDSRIGKLESAPPDARTLTFATPSAPDDLKIIEGVGPRMEAALIAAGIDTYAKLANASESDLRAAVEAAGMSFAPSIPTWARQAQYLVDGDMDGFQAYIDELTAGRS